MPKSDKLKVLSTHVKKMKCQFCDYQSTSEKIMRLHYKVSHKIAAKFSSNSGFYICESCGKKEILVVYVVPLDNFFSFADGIAKEKKFTAH